METSFFWFGVFSGSFGVRSIVLCKCSGKYIDIYFKLKIIFPDQLCLSPLDEVKYIFSPWCQGYVGNGIPFCFL